jgi:hypothetical protein
MENPVFRLIHIVDIKKKGKTMRLKRTKTKSGYIVRLEQDNTVYQAKARKLKTAIKKAFSLIERKKYD